MADKKQSTCGCGCMPTTKKRVKKGSNAPKQKEKKAKK